MDAMSLRRWMLALTVAAAAPLSALALVGNDPPAEEPPAEQPAPAGEGEGGAEEDPGTAGPAGDPVPDLDDLLGLPKDASAPAPARPKPPAEPPADPAATDLERKLSGEEAAEQFREAVRLMNETSVRLQGARDTGVVTQRLQEDVLRKLDMMIKAAERQRSRSRSSSSSQQQQQQQDQQSQPNQQQRPSNQSGQGDNRSETEPPARQDGPLGDQIGGYGATWGALPARVRDALMQGSSDRFSSLYQKMTESYYRRLAEEEQR